MASSDPVGDMIAMIKNANQRRHPKLGVPHSKLKEGVAQVLKSEGYLSDVKVIEDEKKPYRKTMWLFLKYDPENRRDPSDTKRGSAPARGSFPGCGGGAHGRHGLRGTARPAAPGAPRGGAAK